MTVKKSLLKLGLLAGGIAAANAYVHHEGYTIPGRTMVRCRSGHEFSTIWVSGMSVASLRLGLHTRFMKCPECNAWRIVHPIKPIVAVPEEPPVAA
jgi:hypothetical protein